ncbi:MAG: methylated-DNA--[protein]-cysteine S-methyltransferase [Dehalococcoidales bacterium]|nr:methylated-DNA--[protein]-cysteine S-methyltransferase [Dehalococcoidales bacterium]
MNIKTNSLSYHVFETELGWVACLGSDRGLSRVTLPQASKAAALEALEDIGKAALNPLPFKELEKQLKAYYRGQRTDLDFPLDFSEGTSFRQKVWAAIKTIPYGETRSYGWIAQQAGRPGGARTAGQAVGDNPLGVVVPCHRVIAADGSLGGFGKGARATDLKKKLLKLEKIDIK